MTVSHDDVAIADIVDVAKGHARMVLIADARVRARIARGADVIDRRHYSL